MELIIGGQEGGFSFIVYKKSNDPQEQVFYGLGCNDHQQLGFINNINAQNPIYYGAPIKLPVLNELFVDIKIVQISTGETHSLFLTDAGDVYSCGYNISGQCGHKVADNNDYIPPTLIKEFADNDVHITQVSSGLVHNLCVDDDQKVRVFGVNSHGQLGLDKGYKASDPRTGADGIGAEKQFVDVPVMNPFLEDIKFIDCGDDHSLCIDDNGKAFTFGKNRYGRCGNGTMGTNAKVIKPFCVNSLKGLGLETVVFGSGSCGPEHTMLVITYPENMICGFGCNHDSQIGAKVGDYWVNTTLPYGNRKRDIGVDESADIVKVVCDRNVTIVCCEVLCD